MISLRKKFIALLVLLMAIFIGCTGWAAAYADVITVNGEELEVHTLHKPGSDSENLIILLLGDGYTESEQNKFTDFAAKCTKTIISTEPFKTFSDKINIYAVSTVSNVSGVSGTGELVDTYFGVTYYGTSTDFDYARDGAKKARAIKQELENEYLDNGADITRVHVVSNSSISFGAAPTGNVLFSFASQNGLFTNGEASMHELAHSIGKLKDEYGYSPFGPNTSNVGDAESVPWKDLLGFRGVGITPNGNAMEGSAEICYIPTLGCIMKDTGNGGFCEVCKLELVRRMNLLLYPKKFGDYYIAEPDITIEHSKTSAIGAEYEKYRINDNNIVNANGHDLEYRTIVQNLTNRELCLEAHLEIIGENGDKKIFGEKRGCHFAA